MGGGGEKGELLRANRSLSNLSKHRPEIMFSVKNQMICGKRKFYFSLLFIEGQTNTLHWHACVRPSIQACLGIRFKIDKLSKLTGT